MSQEPAVYIGVAIPKKTQLPILFNDSISVDANEAANKATTFLQNADLKINDEVKLSVLKIDQHLFNQLSKTFKNLPHA